MCHHAEPTVHGEDVRMSVCLIFTIVIVSTFVIFFLFYFSNRSWTRRYLLSVVGSLQTYVFPTVTRRRKYMKNSKKSELLPFVYFYFGLSVISKGI